MDEPQTTTDRRTPDLMGPDMPADNGLGSLGLIMQLGGSVFMGVMALTSFVFMLAASRVPGGSILMLIGVLGVVRSAMHRGAGRALLYGTTTRGPFRATLHYAVFAIVHSLMVYWVLGSKLHMAGPARQSLVLMMLAWPVTLLVVISLPRFKRFVDEIPVPEDRGYEGAGVLMVLFGLIGALSMGILALTILTVAGGRLLDSMEGLLVFGCVVGLGVRSIMHVRAGLVAVHDRGQDQVSDAATTYTNWGIMTSLVTGAVLLLVMMMNRGGGQGMLTVAVFVFLLIAWPLILRQFFTERDFTVALDPSAAGREYRSPDLGMTALGWLLLAGAVMALAGSLTTVDPSSLRRMGAASALIPTDLAHQLGRSRWWSILSACLQLWAAIELIGMTKRWKLSVYIYGAVATAVTVYISLPILEHMAQFLRMSLRRGPGGLLVFGQIAIALVIPVGGMLLANRHKGAGARARIRPATDDRPPV